MACFPNCFPGHPNSKRRIGQLGLPVLRLESSGSCRHRRCRRLIEYRDFVRLRIGFVRCDIPAPQTARPPRAFRVPMVPLFR